MENSIFSKFEELELHDSHKIYGGMSDDSGTSSYIVQTNGTSGLDAYNDPVYNDGERGDWSDRDACNS